MGEHGSQSGLLYESIGGTYSATRCEDPRIRAEIHSAIGDAERVVNVGAGTGNYEPADRLVVAVEPSTAMVSQRVGRSPLVVRALADALPLRHGSFDAALAILTVHHWSDASAGLAEMGRVAARQVVFFYEPLQTHGFWALDYFPEARQLPSELNPPGEAAIRAVLQVDDVRTVMVPADCQDGFGAAYWQRPAAYLDPVVQAGMSWLALLSDEVLRRGSQRLRDDLDSGAWDARYGELRHQDIFDGGYRIALCGSGSRS